MVVACVGVVVKVCTGLGGVDGSCKPASKECLVFIFFMVRLSPSLELGPNLLFEALPREDLTIRIIALVPESAVEAFGLWTEGRF